MRVGAMRGFMLLVGLAVLLAGCAVRTGTYQFDKTTPENRIFKEGFGSYIEGELRTPRFWDFVSIAGSLGWERGRTGDRISYSEEDDFFYYTDKVNQYNANMYDIRATARIFPLKSIAVGSKEWRLAPYVGAGCGFFFGSTEVNKQGEFLGYDIFDDEHYALEKTVRNFSGMFSSWSVGFSLFYTEQARIWEWDRWQHNGPGGLSLGMEYRQDYGKNDPPFDFSASQFLVSLGYWW